MGNIAYLLSSKENVEVRQAYEGALERYNHFKAENLQSQIALAATQLQVPVDRLWTKMSEKYDEVAEGYVQRFTDFMTKPAVL